jgi:hypothetical protein
MDLYTSCSTHCDVTLNARTTLNAIRMISLYAHCWSQLDSGCAGLLSSCRISGIRRISMDMPTINTFRSVPDVLTMTWQQTSSSSSRIEKTGRGRWT